MKSENQKKLEKEEVFPCFRPEKDIVYYYDKHSKV